MSKGKDVYEERRRLEAENDLMQARRANERLHQEEQADRIVAAIDAFLAGNATLVVEPGNNPGSLLVRFAQQEDQPHG